jgi:hypothetical protein
MVGEHRVVASSLVVSSVSYVISGNGFSKTGSADIDSAGHGFSFSIRGLPAGKGYQIDCQRHQDDV